MTTKKYSHQIGKPVEVPGSRRVRTQGGGVTVAEVQYVVTKLEYTYEDAPAEPVPEPQPVPVELSALPSKTATSIYHQIGRPPLPVTEAGDAYPRDGSLYIAIANSIDSDYENRNTPTVGTTADEQGFRMHWNHAYGRPAGTRINFQRMAGNFGQPVGLLPYANSVIHALLDFDVEELRLGGDGGNLWTTLPIEAKSHDFNSKATVQCNVNPRRQIEWATAYPGMTIEQQPFTIEQGGSYRMMIQMDMYPERERGRWQAWIDGKPVVDMRGQMALPASHKFGGCAAFIPCLYGNQMNGRTVVRIPNLILDTQPIQARTTR